MMITSSEVIKFVEYLNSTMGEDHMAKVVAVFIVDENPIDNTKDIYDILKPETIEKYSFLRILRDGESFVESASVAKDDIEADFKLWMEGLI